MKNSDIKQSFRRNLFQGKEFLQICLNAKFCLLSTLNSEENSNVFLPHFNAVQMKHKFDFVPNHFFCDGKSVNAMLIGELPQNKLISITVYTT